MLRLLPVTPALPDAKSYAIANVPYYHDTRVILQTRTRFWERDGVSPNMEFGETPLYHVWSASQEVKTTRGLLAGTASGAGTADARGGDVPEVLPRPFRRHREGPRRRLGARPVGLCV